MSFLLDDLNLTSVRKCGDRSCAWDSTQGSRCAIFYLRFPFLSFLLAIHPSTHILIPRWVYQSQFHWKRTTTPTRWIYVPGFFLVFHTFLSRFSTYRLFFFQNPPWLVGRRPFVFSFVSLRFTLRYLDFLHFGFDSSRFSSLCFLSECVVLVLSPFSGTFIVLFVLAFVFVGVSASGRKENRQRTPIEIHETHSVPFFIPCR